MQELLERYKLAASEYRAEVTLGIERQKLFLALNPAIAALSAGGRSELAALALCLAMLASLGGVLIVGRSHARYQQTRAVLLERARPLGAEGDWQTTGGMREARSEPRFERGPRVVTVIQGVLVGYAAWDLVAIVLLLRPS